MSDECPKMPAQRPARVGLGRKTRLWPVSEALGGIPARREADNGVPLRVAPLSARTEHAGMAGVTHTRHPPTCAAQNARAQSRTQAMLSGRRLKR
jgi:hypothetical protein